MSGVHAYPRKPISDEEKLVRAVVSRLDRFPIGYVFCSARTGNPHDVLNYGTWVSIGSGSVTIGGVASKTLYFWERTS